MKFLFSAVLCFLCVNLTSSNKNTYRAGVVLKPGAPDTYSSLIHEAAKMNVDILVLPSPKYPDSENSVLVSDSYEEIIKSISEAVKQAGLYVVAHIYETARCQNQYEVIRSNLVFDREGNVLAVHRTPLKHIANCTLLPQDVTTFTTDFGVNFGLLMEEDLVLLDEKKLGDLKNIVVMGSMAANIPFFTAPQFAPAYSFTKRMTVITSSGMYCGGGTLGEGSDVVVADIMDSVVDSYPPVIDPTQISYPGEDLSQYSIKPLDLQASLQGYTETVCHGKFCCEFEVKTVFTGYVENEVSFGLAAFDGVRHYDGPHRIGVQVCGVFVCAGLYKRSCHIGSKNNSTNTVFEKIVIRSNSTNSISEYPIIIASDAPSKFKFDVSNRQNTKTVAAEVGGSKNLFNFAIVSRVYEKDSIVFVTDDERHQGLTDDIYEYFFNEETQEFFDYMWIRVRIVAVVISIYVLEML